MGLPARKQDENYTYGDYLTWDDGERWELIDGVAYNMTPAPSRWHQDILMELSRQFSTFLLDKECTVYAAPFDVRLPLHDEKDEDVISVVQPDLVVVCDRSKLDEKGCRGGPDLVIEILSPSTSSKDLREKFALYERSGVREYWSVHPTDKIVMIFTLDEHKSYGKPRVYSGEDKIEVGIFGGDLVIDLGLVFRDKGASA